MKATLLPLLLLATVGQGLARHEDKTPLPPPVRFRSNGIELEGEVHRPVASESPLPGVVLVHGSGRFERAASRRGARRLAEKGLAVLLYDKRGTGNSGGRYRDVNAENSEAQITDLADDANSALRFLASLQGVDASRVGGSQAGWVMPLAAECGGSARFLIVISGPAVSVGLEIRHGALTREGKRTRSAEEVERALDAFRGPHGYDPQATLHRLGTPTLWILGGRDANIPLLRTLAVLRALPTAASGRLTIRLIEDADHQMRLPDGSFYDYAEETAKWLRKNGVLARGEPD